MERGFYKGQTHHLNGYMGKVYRVYEKEQVVTMIFEKANVRFIYHYDFRLNPLGDVLAKAFKKSKGWGQ